MMSLTSRTGNFVHLLLVLTAGSVLPVGGHAQSGASAVGEAQQVTQGVLSRQVKALREKVTDDVTDANERLQAHQNCAAQNKQYSPGASGADGSGCVSPRPTLTCSGADKLLQWDGSDWSCATADVGP